MSALTKTSLISSSFNTSGKHGRVRLAGVALGALTLTLGLFQFIPGSANGDGTSWSSAPIELTGFPDNSPPDGAYGGNATLNSISCASAGNCSAGGYYQTDNRQAFVVNEVNYTWQIPVEITDQGGGPLGDEGEGGAVIQSVSCAPNGSCSAGGDYYDSSGNEQAFVVNEGSNGVWGPAQEIQEVQEVSAPSDTSIRLGNIKAEIRDSLEIQFPLGNLNVDNGSAEVVTISCGSTGSCSAGGDYNDVNGYQQAFVVNEGSNGVWGDAQEITDSEDTPVPLGSLGEGDYYRAYVASISCSSDGSCSAGGDYYDSSGNDQAFVVNGTTTSTWSDAQVLENSDGDPLGSIGYDEAYVTSVSCPSVDNCSATGVYNPSANRPLSSMRTLMAIGMAVTQPPLGR